MYKRLDQRDITRFEKKVAELEARKKASAKKLIVNAGLLKAGKSTLFNALLGEKVFESDVIRATVKNEKKEAEGYFLLDTPGLDANEQDTKEALIAYEEADAIVFVHNLQEGEFNQVEIDSIEKICGLYGDKRAFFQKTVLVLSHKDQVEEQYPDICKRIEEQCGEIMEEQFCGMVCVDSAGYLKGMEEDKELLKKASGIPELMEVLQACILNGVDLQTSRIKKEKDELIDEIDDVVAGLKKEMPKGSRVSAADIAKAVADMRAIADRETKKIRMTISLPEVELHDYKYYGRMSSYTEYKSQYDARAAGENALKEAIGKIAALARRNAVAIVAKAEYYIDLGQAPKEILDKLSDIYEDMRRCASKAGVTINTNFTIVLRDPSKVPEKEKGWRRSEWEEAVRKLSDVRDQAQNIGMGSFSSISRYIKIYDIFIDSDMREEYVKGMFGYKWKQVWYYSYDIEGTLIEVSSDGWELVRNLKNEVNDIEIGKVFLAIVKDLGEQFKTLIDKMIAEMNAKKKEVEKQEQEIQQKRQDIQDQITRLERCRQTAVDI